jgi:hypothetical protein
MNLKQAQQPTPPPMPSMSWVFNQTQLDAALMASAQEQLRHGKTPGQVMEGLDQVRMFLRSDEAAPLRFQPKSGR